MQVGTSCFSAVSRGIDYTFTWEKRLENVALGIFPLARWIHLHRNPNDLREPLPLQMPAIIDQPADPGDPFHVNLLGRR